jgi:hypothetical protein
VTLQTLPFSRTAERIAEAAGGGKGEKGGVIGNIFGRCDQEEEDAMSFVDKLKAGAEQAKELAEQAASKAKEEARELQAKRELGQAEAELGRKTFALIESGALSHGDLNEDVERIRALKMKLAELAGRGESESSGDTDRPDAQVSSGPPAMPS